MSVQLVDNFKLLKNIPLDSRVVVNDLNDIPTSGRYPGMIVYQLSDETYYSFIRGAFQPFDTGSSGVTSINTKTGDIYIVEGTGIKIVESPPGEFRIQTADYILQADGSVKMESGYLPLDPQDVTTKNYVDNLVVSLLGAHTSKVMSDTELGHAKIDDESISLNPSDQLVISKTDGGEF